MVSRSSPGRLAATVFSSSRYFVSVRTLVAIWWRSVAMVDYSLCFRGFNAGLRLRYTQGMRSRITLVALLLCVLPTFAGKKRGYPEYVKPDQVIDIPSAAASVSTAKKNCLNYGWAAAVETMLRVQGLTFKQQDI